MKFEQLDLNDNVLDALYDMRFETCTPVQEKCIPQILQGKDVMGVAQTGTGKTAAYLLPILSMLDDGGYPKDAINCVIMSPTRELAQQIDQAMQGFGYYLNGVSSVAVYGGNDGNRYDQEVKSLSLGADVVIATPGRLISHLSLGNVDFSKVSFFVLDEADRMLDMGFSDDILTIAKQLPPTCQTVMFSATMPDKIEELARTLLKDPAIIKLAVSKPAEKINQSAYVCYETQKLDIIKNIFKHGDLQRVIIFCGSKQKVKQVNMALQRKHVNSGEMHSDLDQAQRDEMMFRFKSGQLDVLVATDIVARGIDIDDIAMVINYDVPHDAEDYVHRIGRTARADKDGVAITFVAVDDIYYFKQIEKFLGKEVTKNALPEGIGEGPDYTAGGRGGKSTAKDRRRKNRNETAHRHKPRHQQDDRNSQRPTAENDRQTGGEKQQRKEKQQDRKERRDTGKQAQEERNGQRRQRGNKPQEQTGEQQTGRNERRNRRNDRQTDSQRTDKRIDKRGDSQRTDGKQRKDRRPRNNRQQRQDTGRQPSAPVSAPTEKTAAKKDNAVISFLKRPLKWLRKK